MAICRDGCGATITFIKMRSGKFMPVDGEAPKTYHLYVGKPGHPHRVVILDNGTIAEGREGAPDEHGVKAIQGRESHFASCPEAAKFRTARSR